MDDMLNKKGLNAIIGVMLLMVIVMTLALLILTFGKDFISNLSPPVDCSEISFEAEIFKEGNEYFLGIVNNGDKDISGIVLKSIKDGEIKAEKDFEIDISSGNTEEIVLDIVLNDGDRFLVAPKIVIKNQNGEETLAACSDDDGYEMQFREIIAG